MLGNWHRWFFYISSALVYVLAVIWLKNNLDSKFLRWSNNRKICMVYNMLAFFDFLPLRFLFFVLAYYFSWYVYFFSFFCFYLIYFTCIFYLNSASDCINMMWPMCKQRIVLGRMVWFNFVFNVEVVLFVKFIS